MNYTSGLLLVLLITVVVFASVIGPSVWRWAMGQSEEGFQTTPSSKLTEQDLHKSAEQLADSKISEIKMPESQSQQATVAQTPDGELSKYPIPWQKFEEKIMETDAKQERHIEDIRRVLSTTINTLVEDDVLPAGTAQNCDANPVVNPSTGKVDPADGCRPPGWLRMMNARNMRNGLAF
jgi:hypothetical protein